MKANHTWFSLELCALFWSHQIPRIYTHVALYALLFAELLFLLLIRIFLSKQFLCRFQWVFIYISMDKINSYKCLYQSLHKGFCFHFICSFLLQNDTFLQCEANSWCELNWTDETVYNTGQKFEATTKPYFQIGHIYWNSVRLCQLTRLPNTLTLCLCNFSKIQWKTFHRKNIHKFQP